MTAERCEKMIGKFGGGMDCPELMHIPMSDSHPVRYGKGQTFPETSKKLKNEENRRNIAKNKENRS